MFGGSVQTGVVLSHSVEHDHQLTKESTNHTNGLSSVSLLVSIDISKVLCKNAVNKGSLLHELVVDLLAKSRLLLSLALGLSCRTSTSLFSDLLFLGKTLLLLNFVKSLMLLFDLDSVHIGHFVDVVGNELVRVLVESVQLSNELLCLREQPRQHICVQGLLLELVVEVSNILQVDKTVLLDVLQVLLGQLARCNLLVSHSPCLLATALQLLLGFVLL